MATKPNVTGNQLLEWLKAQSPQHLKCAVGMTGHFGELLELDGLPDVMEVKRDERGQFGKVTAIVLPHIYIGDEPD